MEYMEEEHLRCKRWIECWLVSSVVQNKTGKEFKCLCHNENKRKHFNASPEYWEFFKELIRLEIEEVGTFTFEANKVQVLGEHQE